MAAIRTAVYLVVFYGITVPYVGAALIGAALGERPMHSVIHAWVAFHGHCARWILGIRTRVEGVIPEEQVFFAAKHQAMFETLDLLNRLDTPVPVLKKELTDIPAWGWLAHRYGGISVDRKGGAKTLRAMLKRTRAMVATGRSIMIFPEGTRVRPGDTPPLQSGFAGLYKLVGLPVVPVAVESGHVWPRDGWIKRPGTVTYRFFEPIPAGLDREEIERRVHDAINSLERG
jgi:1-acyl-sn-glycerol-3-phosphate acyltransferase